MPFQRLARVPLVLFLLVLLLLLTLPLVAVLGVWWPGGASGAESWHIVQEMARTVLPDYVGTTVQLALLVGLGVVVLGLGTAAAVTLFDFPGRRVFEWALLLPLALSLIHI